MNEKPLIDKKYILEKFPGKGGWTFAAIPEIKPDKKLPFGWVQVRGRIDSYEIKNQRLMPMGNGLIFLPVRSEIRKAIRKTEGDWVHVVLYADNIKTEIPEELAICLSNEPVAFEGFMEYSEGEKKAIIRWIYSVKQDETRVQRIVKTLKRLESERK
jgi:hypothetical protein